MEHFTYQSTQNQNQSHQYPRDHPSQITLPGNINDPPKFEFYGSDQEQNTTQIDDCSICNNMKIALTLAKQTYCIIDEIVTNSNHQGKNKCQLSTCVTETGDTRIQSETTQGTKEYTYHNLARKYKKFSQTEKEYLDNMFKKNPYPSKESYNMISSK